MNMSESHVYAFLFGFVVGIFFLAIILGVGL